VRVRQRFFHDADSLERWCRDHEVLLEDSLRIAARARAAGVDVTLEVFPEMIHVFHAFVGVVPEAGAALDEVAAFLRRHVGQ